MNPLTIPDTLPEYAQGYLRQLDEAITKTVHDATVTSDSYRSAAELYRQTGRAWDATLADCNADKIDLDPRLYVAGVMHNSASDGTAKLMLHTYLGLLEEQVRASRGMRSLIAMARRTAA